jgi:hypothetical protein
MVRFASILILIVSGTACGADDEHVIPVDAAALDAASPDAGVCVISPAACVPPGWPAHAVCEAAVALGPDTSLTGQDTATGGYGECASSASGTGGPSLYYTLTVPLGKIARIRAAPTDITTAALIRAFPDCGATATTHSERGGSSIDGRSTLCLRNDFDSTADLHTVIAVSQYSGEEGCLPLVYDLSVTFLDSPENCVND